MQILLMSCPLEQQNNERMIFKLSFTFMTIANVLSRVWVTEDGVRIGNWIY
jgi:hypothetical protein